MAYQPAAIDGALREQRYGAAHELRRRAMGSDLHVVVLGPASLLRYATDRIEELEAGWSRFRPQSDISRCNETRGIPVDVSADTRLLVRHAIEAWRLTSGQYDPTVYDALVRSGYAESYERIASLNLRSTPVPVDRPAGYDADTPGCDSIEVNDDLGTVLVPRGIGFDPGGIGKGLAADLVVEELMMSGADGALVNLGGDLRCAGISPAGDGWTIDLAEPSVCDGLIAKVSLREGAVATTTTNRRTWTFDDKPRHHLIDPRTADTAETSAQLVTVVAADAWWAEARTKEMMLAPPTAWPDIVANDAALVVDNEDQTHRLGRIEEYIR